MEKGWLTTPEILRDLTTTMDEAIRQTGNRGLIRSLAFDVFREEPSKGGRVLHLEVHGQGEAVNSEHLNHILNRAVQIGNRRLGPRGMNLQVMYHRWHTEQGGYTNAGLTEFQFTVVGVLFVAG